MFGGAVFPNLNELEKNVVILKLIIKKLGENFLNVYPYLKLEEKIQNI